ncbi:hypothetical protein [Vogesella mureinivorans]|uniref:hypothetical protein n=1 Tax=Vogesella mureinivorans TaxID=657276 RepID=UPI001F0D89AE|nr:hypothetical protein [Vogesella mureinivorans]
MAKAKSGVTYAQVVGGKVHWLFTRADLAEWDDGSIHVVEAVGQVAIGDTYDGELFLPAGTPEPQALRLAGVALINAASNNALQALTAAYPEREINSWPQQEREARSLEQDVSAAVPLLSAIASARGLDVAELAARVREKSDAFAIASGAIIGRRQALEDVLAAIDLDAPDAASQIEAVQWGD